MNFVGLFWLQVSLFPVISHLLHRHSFLFILARLIICFSVLVHVSFWQMLECVQVCHDRGIIHTDLKPANFVLVRGALKIIDFGISHAIEEHTVHARRDAQVR